ncbi:PIN domain-containing protein, partial [Kitasatospora sp. NPDC002965]
MSSEDRGIRFPQPARSRKCDRRTYVLDTSVLLADPLAMTRFEEHEVVLPVV